MPRDTNPEISIVMPVFNVEKYIKEAIESILSQTFKNWELIIMDDGSTDKTALILEKYIKEDKRIKYVRRENNVGIIDNLNNGVALAKSQLIARMDGDDISLPERLEIEYQFMKKNPKCVLVGTWAEMIDKDGNKLQDIKYKTQDFFLRAKMLLGDPFIHGSILMRKKAFVESGGYPSEYKYCEDYALWIKIMKLGLIANIPQILYKWRQHDIDIQSEKLRMQKRNTEKLQSQMRYSLIYLPERIILFTIKIYQTFKRWLSK